MPLSIVILLILLVSRYCCPQVFPAFYTYSEDEVRSVNGSSADPTSDVLIDGHIPELTGLDGDMWASQLLTLQADTSIDITFDFRNTSGYVGLRRVEVVMFNCPQWGLSVQSIRIKGATSLSSEKTLLSITNLDLFSCESLLRICLSQFIRSTVITLQFDHAPESSWVHVAEISFFANGANCPADSLVSIGIPDTTSSTHRDDTTVVEATSPSTKDTLENMTACSSCCSSSTNIIALSSVLSAITSALLTTVISVAVQISICKCCMKSRKEGVALNMMQWKDHVYAEVDGTKENTNPTYAEIGKRSENITNNEAYGILK